MTLTTAQIATTTGLVHANRVALGDNGTGWDKAGILKYVEQLATDPRPAAVLEAQAIAASYNPTAQSPAAILWRGNPEIPDEQPATSWKTRPADACEKHGNTGWRPNEGMFVCCLQEAMGIDDA